MTYKEDEETLVSDLNPNLRIKKFSEFDYQLQERRCDSLPGALMPVYHWWLVIRVSDLNTAVDIMESRARNKACLNSPTLKQCLQEGWKKAVNKVLARGLGV